MVNKQRKQFLTLKESVMYVSYDYRGFTRRLGWCGVIIRCNRGITSDGEQAKEIILYPQRVSTLSILWLYRFYEETRPIILLPGPRKLSMNNVKRTSPSALRVSGAFSKHLFLNQFWLAILIHLPSSILCIFFWWWGVQYGWKKFSKATQ